MDEITFSTRPFTMGELELAYKVSNGDISATIDIIVARSEPPVTREYVCSLTESEAQETIVRLGKSLTTVAFLRNLLGDSSS